MDAFRREGWGRRSRTAQRRVGGGGCGAGVVWAASDSRRAVTVSRRRSAARCSPAGAGVALTRPASVVAVTGADVEPPVGRRRLRDDDGDLEADSGVINLHKREATAFWGTDKRGKDIVIHMLSRA